MPANSFDLTGHRRPIAEDLSDRLHSSTYRDLDSSADTLIGWTTSAIADLGTVELIQAKLDTFPMPGRSAGGAVPTPPIAAVLTTAVYLRYIGQEPTAQNLIWTLHHYWTDHQSEALSLTDWRRKISKADNRDSHTIHGLRYLHIWIAAVVECADGIIA